MQTQPPKFDYTPEQKSAINTIGCNLLVSAAAGSGKTAVLVERIIRLITNPENLIDIDRLLVVTFTDAAAKEMRTRISDAIYEKLENLTDGSIYENITLYEHLKKQAMLLNKAQISTLHKFCTSVIRANFFAVGVDPFFKTADETESELLKLQALDNVLNREYVKIDEDGRFENLYTAFSEKGDAEALRHNILEFYKFLSSTYWQDEWIEKHKNEFNISGEGSIDSTPWVDIVKSEVRTVISGVISVCEELLQAARAEAFGYDEAIKSDLEQLEVIITALKNESSVFNDIANAVKNYTPSTLKAAKGIKVSESEAHRRVKEIRDKSIKDAVKKLAVSFFSKSGKQLAEDIKGAYTVIEELCRVTKEFSAEYSELKRDKNVLDFNDLEIYCIKCLLDESSSSSNVILAQPAINLREKFVEVMVDEYQDINELQELILQCVSDDNCFMVGDLKQSIYRFRQAKPELFSNKYKSFSYEKGSKNRKIDLSGNFRSSEPVINGVNFLFRQIMTEQYGGTDYSEKEKLSGGNPDLILQSIEDEMCAVEMLIIDSSDASENSYENQEFGDISLEEDAFEEDEKDLKSAELEAIAIASRIHEMVNGEKPLQVFDKKTCGLRNVKYGDIVILMRSVKSVSSCFDEAFKKADIPFYSGSSSGYFDSFEVKVMLSFLQIIDNPLQDIAVMAALYSPVYSVTSDEMVQIGSISNPDTRSALSFYDKIVMYAENNLDTCSADDVLLEKIRMFITDLERWQELALTTPVSQLLDIVLTDTGYFNYAGVMLKGKERQINLIALKEYAMQYEKTSYKGIFNFVKYIEKLKKSKIKNDSDINILSENDDAVRILTIHKSKGLEFPVVFVSRTGSTFNRKDENEPILFSSSLGFGIRYLIVKNGVKYKIDTISRTALKCKIRSEDVSEQIRNLYVAATRAKEKLIFTGTVKNIEKSRAKWERFSLGNNKEAKLPAHFIAQTNNFLDMIMTAVNRSELIVSSARFGISYLTKDEVLDSSSIKSRKSGDANKALSVSSTEETGRFLAEIDNKFSWVYPYESDCNIRAKISVSEAKRIYQSLTETADSEPMFKSVQTPTLPDFVTGEKPITGSERGMAIHTVMEHINLNEHRDVSAIKGLIAELVNKLILSEKLASSVPIDKIYNFVHSELAKRMQNSSSVNREVSFIMNVASHEIYGEKRKESGQPIIIQGVIDCYFEEDGKIVILDYKSDKGSYEDIAERYKKQMELYKEGIERSTGKKVKECLCYLFETEKTISFDFDICSKQL